MDPHGRITCYPDPKNVPGLDLMASGEEAAGYEEKNERERQAPRMDKG